MVNTSALKKGAPPPRETNRSLIQTDPRPLEGKNKPLQLMVPPEVFLAFSARAGEEFGFPSFEKTNDKIFFGMIHATRSHRARSANQRIQAGDEVDPGR